MGRDLTVVVCLIVASGCAPTDHDPVVTGEEPVATTALEPVEAPADPLDTPTTADQPTPPQPNGPWIRVAWTRDVGDGTDFVSLGNRLMLIGFDTREGRERVLLKEPASYAKPLITPDGAEIVFSVRREDTVYAIDWEGKHRRPIANGFALDVWADPNTGTQWVYVGHDEADTRSPSYGSVHRYRLDDPGAGELVWDTRPVSADSFQLSTDGRYAGGLFPYPRVGVADLASGTWEHLGRGCWSAFSGSDSRVFWFFDGLHRNLNFVNIDTDRRWTVNINDAPGIDGYEVYHPRWTNNSRFLVMTGPYTVGGRDNKIGRGGNQVEVYVGRFDADFSDVEEWTQITHNDAPDFYPDAWIAPGTWAAAAARETRPRVPTTDAVDRPSQRLVVVVRVLTDAPVPTPQSILPYRRGLHGLEYGVDEIVEGTYESATLVVAHWVIRDGEVLEDAARTAGSTHRLTLELYDAHPELEGERLIMDSTTFTLPLYYDVESVR